MRIGSVAFGAYRVGALLRPDEPTTWTGTDVRTGAAVLLALVPREVAASTAKRRATAHPALVPVVDVRSAEAADAAIGTDARAHAVVVLEAQGGQTLDERVAATGPLPAREAVAMTVAIGDALVSLHAAGAVHAAVAPDAIELVEGGPPRLGLRGARISAIAYESPERIADGALSRRDDGWGLLAVLYFAVSGGPPFAGATTREITQAVLQGRPPPIRVKTRADAALQRIFDRGFARVPSQRFADVAALSGELRVWLVLYAVDDDRDEEDVTALAAAVEGEAPSSSGRPRPPAIALDSSTMPTAEPADLATTNELPAAPPGLVSSAPPPEDKTTALSAAELAALAAEGGASRRAGDSDAPTDVDRDSPISSLEVFSRPPSVRAIAPVLGAQPPPPRSSAPTPPAAPAASAAPVAPVARGRGRAIGVVVTLVVSASALAAGVALWKRRAAHPTEYTSRAPVSIASPAAHVGVSSPIHSAPAPPIAASSSAPLAAPSASARSGGRNVNACVAAWFPEDAFVTGADLSFVCEDANGRSGGKKLKRAIVAGGVGRGVTAAMQEMSRYHWFELPVYQTLRLACCEGATVEAPLSSKCDSPATTIRALATATAAHGTLDEPTAAYRKLVECVVAHGEQSLYGETDVVRGGEERAFRAFAARGGK